MPDETGEGDLLTRYLVGESPEVERRAVESRFFSEAEFFDRLCAAEEELIRDYLRDALPAHLRGLVELQLARSPDLRRRLELTRALMSVLARASRLETPAQGSFWAGVKGLFAFRRAALCCAAGAGVLAVAGVSWLGVDDMRLRARPDDARVGPSLFSPVPAVLSFVLSPGATRSEVSPPQRLFVPRGIDVVRMQLPISTPVAYANYRVLLSGVDGGFQVWSADVGPAVRAGSAITVNADVPAVSLERGDYILRLGGLSPGGGFEDIETYSFGVLRP
jgi:anti-sigma factor RsiW